MIVERVLADLDTPDPDEQRGNPIRGSRLGRCGRQSAYMLWPDRFPPEPLAARAKLVFRFGDMIHEMVRREFRRVVPGEWGFEEERFNFKVPLSIREAEAALAKFRDHTLIGQTLRAWDGKRGGLVLDESEPALLVPLHVDGVADLSAFDPAYSLATAEIKSMATGSFRKALQGHVDYSYRVQMATAVEAAGVDTELYVAVRKDTCHVLEVLYSKRQRGVEVRFTKSSKAVEILRAAGAATEESADWETAEVRHPFEPHLLDEARARVRRVVTATPTALPPREYGPSFTCPKCRGEGTRPCRRCKGTGLTPTGRTCGPCKGTLKIPCSRCKGARVLDETELPWQCSYCSHVWHCWGEAGMRLEVDERPHFRIRREDYERSGITFSPPEQEPPLLEPDDERETEVVSETA